MYNDIAGFKVYDNLMKNLYQRHPNRIPIGGTVESVRRTTIEMLQDCYKTFYNPSNMVGVFCGDFEPGQIIRHLNKSITPYSPSLKTKKKGNSPDKDPNGTQNNAVKTVKKSSDPNMGLYGTLSNALEQVISDIEFKNAINSS